MSSGVNASGGPDRDAAGGFGGGGRGGFGGGRGGGGRGGRGNRGAAGFGVRVIHSGVWGFASSPIVTESEIKRITGIAAEVAKASAVAKKVDVKLAPVPAYTEYWSTPIGKDPGSVSTEDKQAFDALLDRALHDSDLRVRVSAIRALGSLKNARAAESCASRAAGSASRSRRPPRHVKPMRC